MTDFRPYIQELSNGKFRFTVKMPNYDEFGLTLKEYASTIYDTVEECEEKAREFYNKQKEIRND